MSTRHADLVAACKVPDSIKNDKHEWMTQENFTKFLQQAVETLALTREEIKDIRDGKVPKAELMAILSNGRSWGE